MIILNPNKYVRIGYIARIKAITGLPVWYKKIPRNTTPVPKVYILLDSQSKNETVQSKSTSERMLNFEWRTTIDVNIYSVKDPGFSDASVVDDIEEKVLNEIRNGVAIPSFKNKDVQILESTDLSIDTDTMSIDRKLIKFENWLSQK